MFKAKNNNESNNNYNPTEYNLRSSRLLFVRKIDDGNIVGKDHGYLGNNKLVKVV